MAGKFVFPPLHHDPIPFEPSVRITQRVTGPYPQLQRPARFTRHINSVVRGVLKTMAERRIHYRRAVNFYSTESGLAESTIRNIFRAYATEDELAWVKRRTKPGYRERSIAGATKLTPSPEHISP